MIAWIVEGFLGLMILCLAWQSLASKEPIRAVAMFVAMGLLIAIVWVRLDAPDVAIAEAAIGAGLTGALLLITIRRQRPRPMQAAHPRKGDSHAE
jgi:energy-converting hydrogenase B subunit D